MFGFAAVQSVGLIKVRAIALQRGGAFTGLIPQIVPDKVPNNVLLGVFY